MKQFATPTAAEIEHAAAVLKAAREAKVRARRRARRAAMPRKPNTYEQAAFLCAWCGDAFSARVLNRTAPMTGRYCTNACRQQAYANRKRQAAARAERVAARA